MRRILPFVAVFDFRIETKRGDQLCTAENTLKASSRRPTLRLLDLLSGAFIGRTGVAAVNVARHGCELCDDEANECGAHDGADHAPHCTTA